MARFLGVVPPLNRPVRRPATRHPGRLRRREGAAATRRPDTTITRTREQGQRDPVPATQEGEASAPRSVSAGRGPSARGDEREGALAGPAVRRVQLVGPEVHRRRPRHRPCPAPDGGGGDAGVGDGDGGSLIGPLARENRRWPVGQRRQPDVPGGVRAAERPRCVVLLWRISHERACPPVGESAEPTGSQGWCPRRTQLLLRGRTRRALWGTAPRGRPGSRRGAREGALVQPLAPQPAGHLVVALAGVAGAAGRRDVAEGVTPAAGDGPARSRAAAASRSRRSTRSHPRLPGAPPTAGGQVVLDAVHPALALARVPGADGSADHRRSVGPRPPISVGRAEAISR